MHFLWRRRRVWRVREKLDRSIRASWDTLYLPMFAFLMFLFAKPRIQSALYSTGTDTEQTPRLHQEPRRQMISDRTDAFHRHGEYITDSDIAFQTDVTDCGSEDQSPSGRYTDYRGRTRSSTHTFDATFLICSAVQNVLDRQIMRRIYSDYNNTRPYRIKTVFLVGLANNSQTETEVRQESVTYGDVLQGNFQDYYFNLTYKTVMGYRWAQLHCRQVKIVLKIDDDVFVDVYKFFDYFLPVISIRRRAIYGYLNETPRVHRRGKFQVQQREFPGSRYPQFCSGFFVVPTRDVIDGIYEVAKSIRYFRLEDVFTYALVRQAMLDVQLVHVDVVTHHGSMYRYCVQNFKYRCKYLAAELSREDIVEYHRRATESRRRLGLRHASTSA